MCSSGLECGGLALRSMHGGGARYDLGSEEEGAPCPHLTPLPQAGPQAATLTDLDRGPPGA